MNNRASRCLAVLLLLLACFNAAADIVRVTSWNVRNPAGTGLTPEMIKQAAAALRQLNPDVILLQGVKDWQTCNDLAQALRPVQYNVAICSAFSGPATGQPQRGQLSILSKQKPYFFWSEPWHTPAGQKPIPGGFAMVALQGAKQRLGFYCLELREDGNAEILVRQLLDHLKTVKQWEANSVQIALLGGGFPSPGKQQLFPRAVAMLQENGFADACFDLAPERRGPGSADPRETNATTQYLLAERAAFGVNPLETSVSGQFYVTCDLELDPAKVAAGWPSRAQELEHRSLASSLRDPGPAATAAASPKTSRLEAGIRKWWWVLLPVGAVLIGFVVHQRRSRRQLRRERQPALLPGVEGSWGGASSYTVVISPQSVTGSAEKEAPLSLVPQHVVHVDPPALQTHSAGTGWTPREVVANEAARTLLLTDLSRWLKEKLVRGLITDRRQLLETQRIAALKARAVDDRLARIERQIQQQTQDYEHRIEELTLELLAAKEENRELIRTRIAQVKLEMAAVRARMLAQTGEAVGSDRSM